MATTVLIVDDHASFRASARMLLESEGFEVVGEADCGEAALRVAAELEPELVLLDVQLPDADGFDLAGRLRPAVILVSSRDREDLGAALAGCGACGFIPKADLSANAIVELLP